MLQISSVAQQTRSSILIHYQHTLSEFGLYFIAFYLFIFIFSFDFYVLLRFMLLLLRFILFIASTWIHIASTHFDFDALFLSCMHLGSTTRRDHHAASTRPPMHCDNLECTKQRPLCFNLHAFRIQTYSAQGLCW